MTDRRTAIGRIDRPAGLDALAALGFDDLLGFDRGLILDAILFGTGFGALVGRASCTSAVMITEASSSGGTQRPVKTQ